jgi:hypothetical protein
MRPHPPQPCRKYAPQPRKISHYTRLWWSCADTHKGRVGSGTCQVRDSRRPQRRNKHWNGKRGQDSFLGLPRGRRVLSKLRRTALLVAQPSSPNGQLRRMQFRSTCNWASVCGSFTHSSHDRGSAGSRGATSQHGATPAVGRRAQAEPHRHRSARSTNRARTGFRSTYRITPSTDGRPIPPGTT